MKSNKPRPNRTGRSFRAALSFTALLSMFAPLSAAQAGAASPTTWKPYVRMEMVGGYVPYQYSLTSLPTTLLVGDRMYRPGAMMAIFPGPALAPVEERVVSISTARSRALAVYTAAKTPKGGWGQPPVADAHNMVLTVTANGSTRKITVPAFGISGPGMTKEQRAARSRLQVALAALDSLRGKSRMYQPVALEAWVLPAGIGGGFLDPEAPTDPLAWPQGVASTEGCHLITAAELPDGANDISRFFTNDPANSFAAVFRPVLPGENGCSRRN